MENPPEMTQAIVALRGAYAAFNRGDIDAAVKPLDAQIEWTEPAEFPGGGAYHGRDDVKHYLAQSRAPWAEGSSEPEQLVPSGNRIVVLVHAKFRNKGSNEWTDVSLADVYTIRDGNWSRCEPSPTGRKRCAGLELKTDRAAESLNEISTHARADSTLPSSPHRRFNPLTREWVLVWPIEPSGHGKVRPSPLSRNPPSPTIRIATSAPEIPEPGAHKILPIPKRWCSTTISRRCSLKHLRRDGRRRKRHSGRGD